MKIIDPSDFLTIVEPKELNEKLGMKLDPTLLQSVCKSHKINENLIVGRTKELDGFEIQHMVWNMNWVPPFYAIAVKWDIDQVYSMVMLINMSSIDDLVNLYKKYHKMRAFL